MKPTIRWIALGGIALLIVLMVGPFQGAERGLGLTDKAAHAVAFGMITGAIFLNWLRASKVQVAGLALSIGIAVELVQALSGRDAELGDVLWDAVGIAVVAGLWAGRRIV